MILEQIVDLETYPLEDPTFQASCRETLDRDGVLVMPGFATPAAIAAIQMDGEEQKDHAYFCSQDHTVYLSAPDPEFPDEHPRNRLVTSSKGCITDDVIPKNSALRTLYDADLFRAFLCTVLGEQALYEYADPLSSINIHYAKTGQELGWHFDNSSFAITLMIRPCESGGVFEYRRNVRNADAGEMNFDGVAKVLSGDTSVQQLSMGPGALVLFRGRNSMHRVTPNEGDRTRMLAVLAYNSEPGIALSPEAQRTFYGRVA